jgi:hypothetical protein
VGSPASQAENVDDPVRDESDAQLIPKPGSYQTFENAYDRRVLESRSSPATDHRPGLALVLLTQLGIGETPELILDDDSVSFLDILLIEQVLQLKDPFLPGWPT